MLEHFFAVSLPNIATIFIAIAMFCSLYPLREHRAWRSVAATVICLTIAALSMLTQELLVPWLADGAGTAVASLVSPIFFTLVLLVSMPLSRFVFDMGRWDTVFCCAAGYVLQNFSHALAETISTVLMIAGVRSTVSPPTGVQLCISALIYYIGYRTFVSKIKVERLAGIGDRRILVVLLGTIVVNIVLDSSSRYILENWLLPAGAFLVVRLSQLFISALLLILGYEILHGERAEANVASARQMIEDERRQYELSRDTIEAINLRCHDIRHQIHSLEASPRSTKFLSEAANLVSIYDATISTGNEALDVILTEKSLLCQSQKIQLISTVDGSCLSFMDESDIYSLFGNALDNAIEASGKVQDPEKRIVDICTRTSGQMVSIQVRNFYDGELVMRDGLPQTTKTDGGLHGYGMRSLTLTAGRYGGSLSIDADGGIFRLNILLPMPEQH